MTLKLINLNLILLLVSCSFSFDKEIINYGAASKSFIINKLGPPSFTNPYDENNVYYISYKMKKEIGKVNQFLEADFLEIYYENDKVFQYNFKKETLPNDIKLSKLDEKSIVEDRTIFEFLRNILSNLRRNNKN